MVCATTMTGLPPCTIYLPLHATPATPMESTKRFRYPVSLTMAFPKRPPGRLPHLKLTRLLIGSLTLRPAILPLENLQPLITQPLLPGTTKVYGQLLRRDFNPLDRSPKTAYGQFTYLMGDGLRPGFLGTSSLPVSNSRCWINSAFPRGLPVREFAFIESSSAGLSVCDR
jgi:hypothetical protein